MVRTRETDDASEERRSKKKKKKPQSQAGLWIGLGVGGGVLLILLIAGVVGIILASRAGEPQAKAPLKLPPVEPPPVQPPQQPKLKDIGDKPRPANSVRTRADRPARLNELRQIGMFYFQYTTDFNNRPPATVQAFTDYIKRDAPGIVQAINEKYYVLVPGVRANNGIVAYEFNPDANGRHGVAELGGRAHEDLTSQELVAQLKAQGSQ